MSQVHYKFKSAKDYSSLTFDGLAISVFDLKQEVLKAKRLSPDDFDLVITNAQSNEEYHDDGTLIPKNTSVFVSRVPVKPGKSGLASATGGGSGQSYGSGAGRNAMPPSMTHSLTHRHPHSVQPPPTGTGMTTSNMATSDFNNPALSTVPQTEDEQIQQIMEQSNLQWEQQATEMANNQAKHQRYRPHPRNPSGHMHPARPLPANYICHRCGQKGHWISDCPTNADKGFGQPRIKRTTGIPKSFLQKIDALPEDKAAMVTADGSLVIAQANDDAWKKIQQYTKNSLATDESLQGIFVPPEFQCHQCHGLLRDAVRTPCCHTAFCDECITRALLDTDSNEHFVCPKCHQRNIVPDQLVTDLPLRRRVEQHIQQWVKAQGKELETTPPSASEPPMTSAPSATTVQPQRPAPSGNRIPVLSHTGRRPMGDQTGYNHPPFSSGPPSGNYPHMPPTQHMGRNFQRPPFSGPNNGRMHFPVRPSPGMNPQNMPMVGNGMGMMGGPPGYNYGMYPSGNNMYPVNMPMGMTPRGMSTGTGRPMNYSGNTGYGGHLPGVMPPQDSEPASQYGPGSPRSEDADTREPGKEAEYEYPEDRKSETEYNQQEGSITPVSRQPASPGYDYPDDHRPSYPPGADKDSKLPSYGDSHRSVSRSIRSITRSPSFTRSGSRATRGSERDRSSSRFRSSRASSRRSHHRSQSHGRRRRSPSPPGRYRTDRNGHSRDLAPGRGRHHSPYRSRSRSPRRQDHRHSRSPVPSYSSRRDDSRDRSPRHSPVRRHQRQRRRSREPRRPDRQLRTRANSPPPSRDHHPTATSTTAGKPPPMGIRIAGTGGGVSRETTQNRSDQNLGQDRDRDQSQNKDRTRRYGKFRGDRAPSRSPSPRGTRRGGASSTRRRKLGSGSGGGVPEYGQRLSVPHSNGRHSRD
ncbi:Retinoblastoma-binding protein [Dispira parvispora]|uniref:Retinoblastoma-binding protein n=1 Tax=Dispira parvispora TaxID=1520584 RepID=A0A9W8ASC7_9FUNG|nr:Retinoblastoma-binding protein [Dispira parvispora]